MGKKKKKKNQSKAFSEIDYIKNRVKNISRQANAISTKIGKKEERPSQ